MHLTLKREATRPAGANLFQQQAKFDAFLEECGRLCLYRKKINLSTCLAGQAVGIKEANDGIWLVSFMDYDLGYIDLEEKAWQPLNNPFGPKALPMS
jgi:hypothetical protein